MKRTFSQARKEWATKTLKKSLDRLPSALMTGTYLQQRARQGSRPQYEAALAQVPHAEPAEYDRIEKD